MNPVVRPTKAGDASRGYYARVPVDALGELRELHSTVKNVYQIVCYLVYEGDRETWTTPFISDAQLAWMCNCSADTISRSISTLQGKGLIEILVRGNWKGTASQYRIPPQKGGTGEGLWRQALQAKGGTSAAKGVQGCGQRAAPVRSRGCTDADPIQKNQNHQNSESAVENAPAATDSDRASSLRSAMQNIDDEAMQALRLLGIHNPTRSEIHTNLLRLVPDPHQAKVIVQGVASRQPAHKRSAALLVLELREAIELMQNGINPVAQHGTQAMAALKARVNATTTDPSVIKAAEQARRSEACERDWKIIAEADADIFATAVDQVLCNMTGTIGSEWRRQDARRPTDPAFRRRMADAIQGLKNRAGSVQSLKCADPLMQNRTKVA